MRKVELETGVRCPCGKNKSIDRADESNPGSSDESPGIAERSPTLPTHYYSIPPKSQAQSRRIRQGDWAYTLGSESGDAAARPEVRMREVSYWNSEVRDWFWLGLKGRTDSFFTWNYSANKCYSRLFLQHSFHTSLLKGLAVPDTLLWETGKTSLSCIYWSWTSWTCLAFREANESKPFNCANPATLASLFCDQVGVKVTFIFDFSAGKNLNLSWRCCIVFLVSLNVLIKRVKLCGQKCQWMVFIRQVSGVPTWSESPFPSEEIPHVTTLIL